MRIGTSDIGDRQVPFTSLAPFLLITFGLAWGILALFILLPNPMIAMFGELTGQLRYSSWRCGHQRSRRSSSLHTTVVLAAYGIIFPDY
jgi:hypothetical protein